VKPKVLPILQALQDTPLVNKDFVEWFVNCSLSGAYTAIQFVKLPFILQIGVWLEYLESKNLVIIGYPASFSIAYIDETGIPEFLTEQLGKEDGTLYYQFERPTGYKSRTDSFRLGIIEGIKYVQAELESSANLKTK